MASKKRTGLDALNEYEAQSGRGTQSTGQQAGGSSGAWRSGLDLLREYEANGGGQNVRNGPYNPDYRTVTSAMRQAQNDAYAEAYEKYKKIYAGSQARARQQQRIADTSNRDADTDIMTSRRKEQESLFRKYQQAMDAAEGRERQTRRIMDAGDEFGAEPNANAQALRDGWQSSEQRMRQAAARQAAAQDQARGQQRTAYELGKQLDQMEKARDYQLAQQADDPDGLPQFKGAYDAVNAGREKPMTLTEMEAEIGNLQYRKSKMEKSLKGRAGEYAVDLGRGVFKGGFEQWATGFESAMSYLEQGANGAAAWALRDLAKAVPDGSLKNKMLSLADDFESYWTGESTTEHERLARQHRDELQKLETEMADKYKGAALWVQQQMPSAGNMLFGAGVSAGVGVNNLATLGVTAGGSSALEAKDNGATDAQALAYGVVAGGLEVFSEKLFGGNPIYDKDAGLVNKAVSKLTDNKTIMKILNSKAFDIASEGLEEVVTEILDPVAEWAIYNGSNTEFADAESIGNAFLGGVFLSVVGNVVDAPAQIRQARYERVMNAAAVELADIAQTVDSTDVQEAAQVIRDKIAYGVTPDAADIGAVLDAMSKEGEAVDTQAVQAAVERSEAQAAAEDAATQERVFQQYNAVMDAQERAQRNAERVSEARSEETTEAINESEAASAQLASELLMEQEAKDAQTVRGRLDAEEARTDAAFDSAVQEADAQALRDAAAQYGYGERMTNALVSGYDGTQDAAQYTERMNAAYEYGKSGMSLTAAQRAAQDIDAASVKEAWSAGREIANAEETGSTAADDGGKRNAGMDPGEPSGAVAGRTGGAAARSAGAERVKERIELENRVRAAGAQYLSGKDIGLPKGSERRSFREAAESTWTDEMRSAAQTLRSAGFSDVHFTVGAISVENQKAKVTRYADGAAIGDTVWVNATATKWTVTQLANHEAFHRQVQDAPYLLDSVRAALVDELGEDGIAELAQRYAEAYEGCYGAEDIDAYVEEICADAYAGMDRMPEAKTEIMQKAARQAQDAQRTAEENGETRGQPEKYSMVGYGSNGLKTYKSNFSSDMTATEKQEYLYSLIKSVWSKKPLQLTILQDGKERSISARFDGESNGQEFAGKMAFGNRRGTRTERLISLNLADDIWEIASESTYDASKGGIKETLAHDGSERWHYFVNAINYVDEQQPSRNGVYDFNLDVMEREDGNFVYTFALKKRRDNAPRTFAAGVNGNNAADANSSDTSIRSSERKSQEKFSAAEETTPQENDKAALSYFGRTYKWSETGYVLLNGARLDFSGRHEGGSGGYRSVDHRDIIDALGEDYGGDSYTGGMVRFMQEGNIRISPESGGINLAVMPTKAQMDALGDFISKERGEVILDIDDENGNTISSTEYPRGTHANKVLQDIRSYFNDGTMPQVSSEPTVGQFRYSAAEAETAEGEILTAEDAGADEAADARTQELLAETLPQANRDQFMRFATKITDDLVTPLTADMETLRKEMRPRVLGLVDEFLQDGALKKSSVNALFDEAYARSTEMNKTFMGKYAELRDMIRKTPVTFTQEETRQIEQYDYFDQRALKNLTIQEQGGASIEKLYSDLSALLPEMFPSDIKNPAKQIMRISSVYRRIGKAMALTQETQSTNPEYFRENAKNEFLESLRKIVPKMRTERELAQIAVEENARMEQAAAERERLLAEEDARIAAEEAAKEPAAVYESLTMDSMPKKAQDYLKRVQGRTAAAIQQTLSMPFAARQEVLKPALGQMMNEYLQTGRITQETINKTFEDSYAKGVELDTEFYDQYKDVKTRLRDMKVTLSEADRADIADYDDFRRAAFGRLRIANEGGVPVDTAYKTMREMAPELFPASVTHPADQLMKMFEVSKRIQKVERSLDEAHGENAEEFKRWAKNDYEASVEGMLGSLRTARRYAEARMRQKQARAVPTTQEEATALWQELKKLRRTYERASAKNLMTAEDNAVLNRLLRGELAPEDVQGMENADGILAMYEAKADYDVAAAKLADWQRYRKSRLLDEADSLLQNAEQAKDKPNGFLYARETMTRNVRDIFPEADAAAINRTYFEPVRRANADANKMKNRLREQVAALDLSRKAAKGDAVSEAHAVQLLGEAQDNIRYLEKNPRVQDRDGKTLDEWRGIVQELWKTSPGLDKAKIESAVESFRKIYDSLFEQMNEVRIRNGYEPINYRRGYFPHFQPGTSDGILSLMGKALGIDAEVTALPTTISGLTHTFKPGITYFGHALERVGFDTAYDAVEGFDKYVEGAASVIYYTDAIQKLRALAQQVRYRTSDEGLRERVDAVRELENVSEQDKENRIKEIMEKGRFSLSNFAQELDEYTNLLANKKSKHDRSIESMAGRKVYNLMKAWENRVAANMVAVNPASWLTNFGVITQAGAQLKTTSVLKAMAQTLQSWKTDDGFVDRSDFLTNRRGSDPLVRSLQQNVSATLSKPMDWIDTFSADTIVRARYMENVERGMSAEDAVHEADDFAANVMAERAKGAMPTLFESRNPISKMFTQFQLEVNNTFSYLFKDLPQEQRKKGVGALAMALFKFLIGGYLYNEIYEHFIGRRPMLDPLGILNDTVGDLTGYELNNLLDAAMGGGLIKESEPEGVIGSAENLAGNLGQELPFIGNIMGGGKLPFASSLPDVGNIASAMKSETATTAEKWAKIGKEMANPAAYWLLPFGGGQVKKMWQGIQALKNQGSYTADGRIQYPIYSDRKGDKAGALARTLLFGKSATPEAQAWVEAGFGALSEKATATYEAMRSAGVDQRSSYELIKAMSKVKKTDDATARQLQMQVLRAFDIEDSGKVLYYYGMMANDKEKAEIDRLMAEGADMGEYLRFLDQAAGVTGEKNENGETISGSKKQETLELINGLDMTPEQKTALMESKNYKATGFEPWTENHDKLYNAVSSGKDLRKTLQSLKKDGYDDETLRAAITDLFKEEYLAADRAGRAGLKGYLRNAFMVCGLSKKQAENKIDKWMEAKK